MPISAELIKDHFGKIVDCVFLRNFGFGKETPLHQIELKAKTPFKSPQLLEENMQDGVNFLIELLNRKYNACLLGTGMHPTVGFEDTGFWNYSDQDNYNDLHRMFNFKCQGWVNTQSYQLNLPYSNSSEAVVLYNALCYLCAYLPAITASSPVVEGKLESNVDNRLYFYKLKMQEMPSLTGSVIPEYISSIEQYKKEIIGLFSKDLANAGANKKMLNADWMNQRGVIFKFSRKAIEIRIMDEQECIKSDVALSCFIRATVRGLIQENVELPPNQMLVKDYNMIVKKGSTAELQNPHGRTAKEVCKFFLNLAFEHADEAEKKYLWIIEKRVEKGNLSEIIRNKILSRAQKTTVDEAILTIYLQLASALSQNQPYF